MRSELNIGVGEIPKDLLSRENTKHSERRVYAVIDVPLWDKAKWKGVLYLWPPVLDLEPWLALGFEGSVAGRAIFTDWRSKLGSIDKQERIRISIITGVDRSNPTHYSVIVGSNLPQSEGGSRVKEFMSWSRIHRMEPSTLNNLTTFVNRFERIGTYRLMPADINLKTGEHKVHRELAIQKRQIRICPAWQIGEHDPDGVGVLPKDKPIVPDGLVDPPVLRLLKRKMEKKK